MAAPGPRTTYRYSDHFKATAVRLSQLPGVTVFVYSCDDARSVVVVSDKDNPALPFYFIVYVKPNGDMQLYGEGTGKKSATQAAFDDLEMLTVSDIATLVEQTKDLPAASGGE